MTFSEHRKVLLGVAYRVLGSVTDAEDVVQEAWLRWSQLPEGHVDDERAYLVRVTTNLAIDRLRHVQTRREAYVGPWLPELVSTTDVAEEAELADTVELALLVVLETLSPLERAVFVLREAFGYSHAEIGAVLGRDEAAVRQLAKRARDHVRERRPRYDVDRGERRAITERFVSAAAGGDLDGLTALLARDVTLVGDGGGKAKAPRNILAGAANVARFLIGIASERGVSRFLDGAAAELTIEIASVNGGPAVVVQADGRAAAVFSLVVADGLIQTVYVVANPEKMSHL
ncbi:sigma-70 family RNA polymerase sigma factor [Herbidospora galbida]|uniref:Sigma-70 family RNA polymerase sigma factor n=1 Tax=Herbidospora galbida TaxID=2575442 RepID=A0A4U3MH50_9ACTN|nr:RNA polymerase sigma factor SigJ [Herbidospora galbida]TKK87939.1 sigma-70 family RNA polymerase sigma factor [Herbidospora galbida]